MITNGHQVQLERFSKPGITLLGSDSHTQTSGAISALSIGAGGLDVALAMAGKPFKMVMPEIVNVILKGKLKRGVTPKDIILEILRIKTVKGGINKVFEYTGEGIETLSVPERAVICNMGAELGLTSSLFPSDKNTLDFLKKEGRVEDFAPLYPDKDAVYDEIIEIDLNSINPLIALPYSPDNVVEVSRVKGLKVDQVLIGSCTNSSLKDMIVIASILKGKKVSSDVSLGINPGSKQVYLMMAKLGILETLISAGARILEVTCGACIGMGLSPNTNGVSLRTYNRNFYGRSGTMSAKVYLVSPVIAALSAITGKIEDPLDYPDINLNEYNIPDTFTIDDSMIIEPTYSGDIIMGPNIKELPTFDSLKNEYNLVVSLKLKDNVSTDDIMPAGSKILPYRSNIEKLSDYSFFNVDSSFKERCKTLGSSVIVAGHNYGQGSSREHAAIVPRFLGIKAVLALSFARIHRQNLINFGIVPLVIAEELYNSINQGDLITLDFKEINNNIVSVNNTIIHTSFNTEELLSLTKGSLLNTL